MSDAFPPMIGPPVIGPPVIGYVNFRDLGGHTVPRGLVRTGRVFRSDSLAHCTSADVQHLLDVHSIRTVIDLRREHEVDHFPLDALRASGIRVEHRSLIDPAIPALTTPDIVDGTLADRYVAILNTSGAQFTSVLRLIADPDTHPLVFQCAVGKDRTGLVAATLLDLLGVDDAAITTDYARTAAVIDVLLARLTASTPDREPPGPRLMSAEASTMQAALDWLHATHGGAEGYLRAHGLTAAEVASLRTTLVEES